MFVALFLVLGSCLCDSYRSAPVCLLSLSSVPSASNGQAVLNSKDLILILYKLEYFMCIFLVLRQISHVK